MIVNHVFIGRGPVKASDLFNVLTWASLGATVNLYVANPDKRPIEEQHTYGSLFNVKQDLGGGMTCEYNAERLFSAFRIVGTQAHGLADRVKLISLPEVLAGHEQTVPEPLSTLTLGWRKGLVKFLGTMSEWWPGGAKMDDKILEKLFTAVDATKFYLAATRQGLVCDMKVAPTIYFLEYAAVIAANFISFQRGNAAVAGFENQLSGSMCERIAEPRTTYATVGKEAGDGFGSKSVVEAARYFEKITAAHGVAMQLLVKKRLGVDSTKLDPRKVVADPEIGWAGPLCVYKHPKDQSWAGRTLTESEKARAKRDIDDMSAAALKLVSKIGSLGEDVLEAMVDLRKFPGFNIYA